MYCQICRHEDPLIRCNGWCLSCRMGYQLAMTVLYSFRPVRPTPAVVRANVNRYRRRAARLEPLFEEADR